MMGQDLSENARMRLYQLVGYPQGEPADRVAAEMELTGAGLMRNGLETAEAHRVAETFLFC